MFEYKTEVLTDIYKEQTKIFKENVQFISELIDNYLSDQEKDGWTFVTYAFIRKIGIHNQSGKDIEAIVITTKRKLKP